MELLLNAGRGVTLTHETVAALHEALTRPAVRSADARTGVVPKPGRRAPLFRTEPLVLAETSYRPTADPIVIEACFRQILGTAAVVADPVEQAFMVFAHLLLLLPFGAENVSLAALAANIPLLRAGLKPMPFVAGNVDEMVTALAAWWELSRVELLVGDGCSEGGKMLKC